MSYKVAPLTVNPKQKSSFMSKAFVSQPSAEEEALVGRLFVLMEIDQSRPEDFALADFIVKDIYHHYYENEQFFLRDKIANLKIDYIFEAAITKLNRGIADFLETQKTPFRPGNLTIVIGVLYKNQLLFTSLGTSKAFLLYRPKTKNNQPLSDYNLMDISEKTDDPTQEIAHQAKLFANVINGTVPAGGYFLFANEALLEYLSKKQLTDIVTTLPPASAAEQMKNLLEQTNAFVAFFAMIVKNTVGEERTVELANNPAYSIPANQTVMGGGRTSVDQFNTTQERTEELLSPSGVLTAKKWLAKLRPTSSVLKDYARDTARSLNVSAGRLKAKQEKLQLGKKIVDLGKVFFYLGRDAASTVVALFTDPSARRSVVDGSKNAVKDTLLRTRNLVTGFQKMKRKQKILLSVIGIAVIVLIVNLVYSSLHSRQAAAEARLTEAKTAFEQKEHQLEASLLYNNTDGARQILNEMDSLIKELPQKTDNEKSTVADLTNRYHAKLDTIFAITRITNPTVYAELPADSSTLALVENELFAGNGQAKAVYKVGTDKQISTLNTDSLSGQPLTALVDGSDLYMYDGATVFSYQPLETSFKAMTIENKPNTLSAVAVYNNRLYAASASDHTIYRFNQDKRTFTFTSRQNWLKGNLEAKEINSLAVNGRIFMSADNHLERFASGNNDNLVFEETTPQLEKPTQVAISSDQALVYVLDPANHRLVVYSADGRYNAQYTSDNFTNLTGLAVSEDNKKLYLLNGKTIYEVDAK